MSLEGKVALVAGATRGAGRGIAVELGAAGATVYATGRTMRAQRSEHDRPETWSRRPARRQVFGNATRGGSVPSVEWRVPENRDEANAAAVVMLGAGLGACGGGAVVEPPERIVFLAIGASDAAGVGADPLTRGYVFRIADELDQRVDQVFLAPLAIPGATAEELDAALQLLLESEIAPNLVTVWTGPNDVIRGEDADDFEDELDGLFERLRDRTDGVIVAANVPDLTELPRFRADPDDDVTRERIEEFNEAIDEQAEDHDVLVVDTYGEPVEDDLVSDEDGFHPNNRGHQLIADRFLEVILPALGLAPVS